MKSNYIKKRNSIKAPNSKFKIDHPSVVSCFFCSPILRLFLPVLLFLSLLIFLIREQPFETICINYKRFYRRTNFLATLRRRGIKGKRKLYRNDFIRCVMVLLLFSFPKLSFADADFFFVRAVDIHCMWRGIDDSQKSCHKQDKNFTIGSWIKYLLPC